MSKKKKETMELRVYEVPQGHWVLPLFGESWVRTYGHENNILHFHNLMEIGICRYGSGELRTVDGNVEYCEGMITVFPVNCPHMTFSYGEEENFWEYLFFDVGAIVRNLYPNSPAYANEIIQGLNAKPAIYQPGEQNMMEVIINSIIREFVQKEHYHHLVIERCMHLLVLQLMRNGKEVPYYADVNAGPKSAAHIGPAIEYIDKHYCKDLRASDLAAECGMSETHFRRIFHEYVDMSPMDYLNLIRVQKACELLQKNDEPMELVAEKCGFLSVSTFNRNFRKFLGTSPYQWKINPDNYEGKLHKYHISPRQGW